MEISKGNTTLRDYFKLHKVPPHSVEIELMLLNGIINSPEKGRAVMRILDPNAFYDPKAQLIAHAMVSLFKADHDVNFDPIIVWEEIKRLGQSNSIEKFELSEMIQINQDSILHSMRINFSQYYRIVYMYHLRRQIITLCQEYESHAFNDEVNVFDMLSQIREKIKEFELTYDLFNSEKKDHKVVTDEIFQEIVMASTGEVKTVYKSGFQKFDNLIFPGPGIMLISGATGAGKTSFTASMMKGILLNNPEASINWRCLDHDQSGDIIRKFISEETLISDKELLSKNKKLSEAKINTIMSTKDMVSKFDIEFSNEMDYIENIGRSFEAFCEKRKDRFNILVIDNVMRLLDNKSGVKSLNQNLIDDKIANTISDISKNTSKYKSLIVYLHHFTKEQSSSMNLDSGYMPTLDQIRGSGRFTDIPEQILLINRPAIYPKLLLEYKDRKELLEYLFIINIAKNSNGSLGFCHMFCNLAYSKFVEL